LLTDFAACAMYEYAKFQVDRLKNMHFTPDIKISFYYVVLDMLVTFIRQTMLLYNGALVILKEVISLNVCAMNAVLLYMIICYLVVCVISFDYSSNSLYFSPSLSSSL